MSELKVVLEHKDARLPKLGSNGSAGYDLYSIEYKEVPAHGQAIIKTGIRITVPRGTYGRIAPRSSLAMKGIDVGAGVIDHDYIGEVGIILFNHKDDIFTVNSGDRIAQLILEVIINPSVIQVNELGVSDRGYGGFGSTGK